MLHFIIICLKENKVSMCHLQCSELLVSLVFPEMEARVSFLSDIGAKMMLSKELMGPAHCEASFRMAELRVVTEEKMRSLLNLGRQHLYLYVWFGMIIYCFKS